MRTLHITVNNKIATYLNRDGSIVCGNSDYQIVFAFDSEWDAHEEKVARFIWNGKYLDVKFTGNTVKVPIVSNTTLLKVGVYVEGLSTTTSASIPCTHSILCGYSSSGEGGSSGGGGASSGGGSSNTQTVNLQEKNVTYYNNGVYTELPSAGCDGFKKVTINVRVEGAGDDTGTPQLMSSKASAKLEIDMATIAEPMMVTMTSEVGDGYQSQESEAATEELTIDLTTEAEAEETTE